MPSSLEVALPEANILALARSVELTGKPALFSEKFTNFRLYDTSPVVSILAFGM